jgi:hypothetical protein
MAKLTKEKRDQLILTGLMSVMIIVAVWMLLVGPTRSALVALSGEVQSTADQLKEAQGLVARAGRIELEMKATGRFLTEMEKDMVEGDPNLWIRSTLNDFYRSAPRTMQLPAIGIPKDAEIGLLPDMPYKALVFQLSGSAYYHEVGKFIADFENRYPYVQVRNLDFRPDGSVGRFGPSTELLSYTFDIVVPVKPQDKKS